jgi:hypothetical protein
MAATKTRKRATAKPGVKGRTSKALKNRHRWTDAELAALVKAGDAAPRGGKEPVFAEFAKSIGNGIHWTSVRAQYYAAKRPGGTPAKPKQLARADKLPASADPVQRVRAMVKRRAEVARAVAHAEASIATMTEQIAAAQAVIESGNAEVTDLDAKLAFLNG